MVAFAKPTEITDRIAPPAVPGEWSLKQIQNVLSRPLPPSLLSSKTLKGKKITFIPWYQAVRILDKYAPGWTWEIKSMITTADRVFLIGRLTILTADGLIYREASGTEELACSSYGDPSSNAESMAFRRCGAKFGLGLHMYDKD